ncbi:MAG: putative phosphoribosyl transferase [Verrucomicrobiota bacterium]
MPARYPNRRAAGQVLAGALRHLSRLPNGIVLGLPRGGVPVAYEIACALELPLDVFIVRKLGVPGHEELAMGAIASGGVRVLNQHVIARLAIPEPVLDAAAAAESIELERRERIYRPAGAAPALRDRTVLLVDDGLATGSTMRAAVAAVRAAGAARILVAVPVAPPDVCAALALEADEVVCPLRPVDFSSVGEWYVEFAQTTDEEVRALVANRSGRQRPENHDSQNLKER